MNADLKTHVIYILLFPIFYYLRDSKDEINDERATLSWNNFLDILVMIPIAYVFFCYLLFTRNDLEPVAKDREPNKEIEEWQGF